MKTLALERTSLLLKTLTLAAMIGGLIPTLAFAQSSQTTNYYGPASASSPPAILNGSVVQSTSYGSSSGMRMLRGQAVSVPNNSTSSGSLFSSDALSSFSRPTGTTYNTAQNSQSVSNATPSQTATNQIDQSQSQSTSQSQSGSAQFDLGKAISLGSTMLHGLNQLANATRQSSATLYGANQMTNSLLNRSNTYGGNLVASAPINAPNYGSSLFKSSTNLFNMGRPLNRNEVNLLSNYDVAVVIDRSGSMQTQDCPGGLSRWDFCREQLLNLTSQAGSAFRSGITVALFSSDYRIFNNVNFSAVPQIFAANYPDGGTYLARPLRDILSTHFEQKERNAAGQMATRPLLVEIITDGEPSDKGALEKVICDATQRMTSPREVNIQFLQIGNDNEGGRVLNELQTRLVPDEGAQYSIVNVEPFQEVLNEGLARSLVAIASSH